MFGLDFLVGVFVGGVVTALSPKVFAWFKKEGTSVETKVESAANTVSSKL